MSSAAMSMSRTIIQARPIRPWTRLAAAQVSRTDEAEHGVVAGDRRGGGAGQDDAERVPCRHLDRTRGIVVVEPGDAVEAPVEEELGRQRGHGQVEALDAQGRQAEDEADAGGERSPRPG